MKYFKYFISLFIKLKARTEHSESKILCTHINFKKKNE